MVERSPEKAGVGGSTPSLATMFSATYNPSKIQSCHTLSQKNFRLLGVCLQHTPTRVDKIRKRKPVRLTTSTTQRPASRLERWPSPFSSRDGTKTRETGHRPALLARDLRSDRPGAPRKNQKASSRAGSAGLRPCSHFVSASNIARELANSNGKWGLANGRKRQEHRRNEGQRAAAATAGDRQRSGNPRQERRSGGVGGKNQGTSRVGPTAAPVHAAAK